MKKYTKDEIIEEVTSTMIYFFENNGWEKYNKTKESGKIVVDCMMNVVLESIHHCIVMSAKSRKYSEEECFMFLEHLMKDIVSEWIEVEREVLDIEKKKKIVVKNNTGTKH